SRRSAVNYWLVKTEPETFSWEDLKAAPKQTTSWEGVRNYQARNHMRDGMKQGDRVLFYHSVVKPQVLVGVAEVAREAYPDPLAVDPKSDYYDPASKKLGNRWVMVDLRAVQDIVPHITLEEIKQTPGLEQMDLVRKGRLSVQCVTAEEWKIIMRLRGVKLK
ncbi:MAG: EVE domain-containing protein, partial [candidate division KSB1 bacterium]